VLILQYLRYPSQKKKNILFNNDNNSQFIILQLNHYLSAMATVTVNTWYCNKPRLKNENICKLLKLSQLCTVLNDFY